MNYRQYRQHTRGRAAADLPVPSLPPDQQAAAAYARQQIARVYGDSTTPPAHPASNQIHNQAVTLEPATSADTSAPKGYDRTYAGNPAETAQDAYDWESYHSAWQNYYQQYYERYYLGQSQTFPAAKGDQSQTDTDAEREAAEPTDESTPQKRQQRAIPPQLATAHKIQAELRVKVSERAKKARSSPHFMPLLTAALVGFLFLFLQFNRTLTAQVKYYISPGTVLSEGSDIIINPQSVASVGSAPRIIIPKINVDVPVVYDETSYDEAKIQKALERGVVHYGTSAMPGQVGNNVIVGHSSNDLFDGGDYKFAFVLIDRLNNGDVFMLNFQGKRYVYKVYHKQVIDPSDFSLINITPDKPVVTLITCTPPGTALKRLVVQAEQISPEPDANQVAAKPAAQTSNLPGSIPGNSPTLLEKLKNLIP